MLGQRFWSKVTQEGDCWVWTAATSKKGYGFYSLAGRNQSPHRLAYEEMIASIPEGLEIDHLCKNTGCVNPYHLEPVTNAENARRREYKIKAYCKNGHAYAGENLRVTPTGERKCRKCQYVYMRRSSLRKVK